MSPVPRVAVTLTQCWHRVPGGTATSVLRLVAALRAGGLAEPTCVVPAGRSRPAPPFDPPDPLQRLPLPLPALYDAWAGTGWPRVRGSHDLVHLTVPVGPSRGGRPLVATVHDVLPLSRPGDFTGRGARLMRAGLGRIRREADLVMVPSEVVAADCVAHGFRPDRLRVVPWGAPSAEEVAAGPADVERVRRAHGLRGDYVLFVGTLEPRKGLDVLARAMVRLGRAEVTLALAGPGGWGDAGGSELAAVPGPVARLGFVPAGDLAALERGAAAFCFPSTAEGFGLPVLESLAAGAAVVTTSGTACAEVAGDAALLVPPGDDVALAAALARVLDDAALAGILRARAPVRASEFTWERTADAVAAVYREALS
jgi:glycosyltransferase involved in cell wall biosynthesis